VIFGQETAALDASPQPIVLLFFISIEAWADLESQIFQQLGDIQACHCALMQGWPSIIFAIARFRILFAASILCGKSRTFDHNRGPDSHFSFLEVC
jgi:hypothetical protein